MVASPSVRGPITRRQRLRARRASVLVAAAALGILGVAGAPAPAGAACIPVAQGPGMSAQGVLPAGFRGSPPALKVRPAYPQWRIQSPREPSRDARTVELTFLGHSSFLIRTPANATAVTDYNGYIRAGFPPDIVTMNRAHSTHYTDHVEPGVRHILRGWDEEGGIPSHDVTVRDLRVRNVPTNIRDGLGGTGFAQNSIFIFESVGLCIVHLGHLHHPLTPEHAGRIGLVDVLLVPIDDGLTMLQRRMGEVVETLRPAIVVPMHYSGEDLLQTFIGLMRDLGFTARFHETATVRLAKGSLPRRTVLVLPGGYF